jgi:hypothetical protein
MSEQAPVGHAKLPRLPTELEGFDALAELALDMRSSWNHAADQIWVQFEGHAALAVLERAHSFMQATARPAL